MDVSIIIVTYNTRQLTLECINSIFAQNCNVSYEIILVDNASSDGSKEYFSKKEGIIYIYNQENKGFGAANNIGLTNAKGKYVFFLNSDTYIDSNILDPLYDFMEKNTDIVACGSQLLWPDGSLQQSVFSFPSIREMIDLYIYNKNIANFVTSNNYISLNNEFISGANIFIQKDIIEKYKGFYSEYFMYYEETDLFYRIIKDGLKIAFNPSIHIYHYNGGSQINDSEFQSKKYLRKYLNYIKSRKLYFKRNNAKNLLLLKFIMSLGSLLRISKIKLNIYSVFKEIWS